MKHCGGCGERYDQRVDFCFHDGEVLVASPPDAPNAEDPDAVEVDRGSSPSGDRAGELVRVNRADDEIPLPARDVDVTAEPPAERSSLLMAGVVLVFMALLVPVVGGGLFTYSWVVTGEWHETVSSPEP